MQQYAIRLQRKFPAQIKSRKKRTVDGRKMRSSPKTYSPMNNAYISNDISVQIQPCYTTVDVKCMMGKMWICFPRHLHERWYYSVEFHPEANAVILDQMKSTSANTLKIILIWAILLRNCNVKWWNWMEHPYAQMLKLDFWIIQSRWSSGWEMIKLRKIPSNT